MKRCHGFSKRSKMSQQDSESITEGDNSLTFEVEPCQADYALADILGKRRYDQLNSTIKAGVIETYKAAIFPECEELIKNDEKIACVVPNETQNDDIVIDDKDWYQDPSRMSSFQLYQAVAILQSRIKRVRQANDQEQKNIELLQSAKESLDLELGMHYVELEVAEDEK